MKLTIELVPQTAWFKNLRSLLTASEWDTVRKKCYREANYCCEICGGVGPNHPVECHEKWEYDHVNHVQTLTGLIALCPACHEVKHIGFASVRGRYYEALEHLAKVNGWILEEARDYAENAMNEWEERSRHQWKLNTEFLNEYKKEESEKLIREDATNPFKRFTS